jgi:hypothetical protein
MEKTKQRKGIGSDGGGAVVLHCGVREGPYEGEEKL